MEKATADSAARNPNTSPSNNELLATVTPGAIGVDTVLTFESIALDTFVFGSGDAMLSFAITQSGATANDRGWDFYARENSGVNAEPAKLEAQTRRPPTIFTFR